VPKPADTQFIAGAREDVPWLLAEVDRLTAERDTWEDRAGQAAAEVIDLRHEVERLKTQLAAIDSPTGEKIASLLRHGTELVQVERDDARSERDRLLAQRAAVLDVLAAVNCQLHLQRCPCVVCELRRVLGVEEVSTDGC
jgi:hypothetical protein